MIWEHSARKWALFSQRIPTAAQQLERRLSGQSGGSQALAGPPEFEVAARDPPQLRIHKIYQAVQRVRITFVPGCEDSGDIVLIPVGHDAEILSQKMSAG